MAGWGKKLLFVLPVLVAYCWLKGDGFDGEAVRGKRVLVTGASSGIGEHVAYRYAELGAKLLITARRAEQLEKVAEKCRKLGAAQVTVVAADMAKPDDRAKVAAAVEPSLGGLDYLVLNHAIFPSLWWTGTEKNFNTLNTGMNVNFFSYVDLSSRLMKFLEASNGYLAVVSSIAGKTGLGTYSHYSASKFALQGYYASLRQELRIRGREVSISLVVLGGVDTEGVQRQAKEYTLPEPDTSLIGSPDEAADALVRGVQARHYEVFYPRNARVLTWFLRIAPHWTERKVNDLLVSMWNSTNID